MRPQMDNEKPDEEKSIDELLDEAIEKGTLKFGPDKNGEPTYQITNWGETEALKVLGGQDIVNVASGLVSLLVKHGNAIGGTVEDTISTWLEMVVITQLWKKFGYMPWAKFVAKIEKEVLEPTGYFRTTPRADLETEE